jgi:hypothetical protein
MAALIALSPRGIAVSIFDVVAAGLVVLFAMQASPAYFVLLATAGVLCAQLLQVTTLDRHPWLRGAILLAVAYGVTVVEGNRLRFEDVHVLSGFLGGALELDLPITATLVASYYAAPIVVAIAVSRWTGETARRCRSTLRAAAMLCLAKIAAVLVGFAWGRLAEGSWSMQLTEVALLATWTVALLFAQVLLVPQRRERAATLLIDAPVESQR